MTGRIVLVEGDITAAPVDAIVNAANSALVLGAGVAGAIAARGGPAIQAECDAHGPIGVGEATEASVRSSMRAALELARQKGCRSIAVPAIGAGIAGLSMQRAAEILIEEARRHLEAGDTTLEEIRFVLFGEPAYRVFEMVHDAAKVAAQMERLRRREKP